MRKKSCCIFVLLAAFAALHAQLDTLYYDGLDRTYLCHVSSQYDGSTSVPLVIALHNAYGSAAGFQSMTGFSAEADSSGFIVVYPNGTGRPQFWNAGGCCGSAIENQIDDVGFISVLIDTLLENYHIDINRIYAAGFSNGSIFTFRLAAELSQKIAAIGAVAGPMMLDDIHPEKPVPIIYFHALDDTGVPFEGGAGSGYMFPSVGSVIHQWIEINGCDTDPDTILNLDGAVGLHWCAGNTHADIVQYTRPTGGHSWPGSNTPTAATKLIWEFFNEHFKEDASSAVPIEVCQCSHLEKYMVLSSFPNPFNPVTSIQYYLDQESPVELYVYNSLGQVICELVHENKPAGAHHVLFDGSGLPSGVYYVVMRIPYTDQYCKLLLLK
ncbi:T9SS type A sorting domain-containing protein [bacterium]|nr:T9SS type A sorting domain-containing protein [bacterium]